MDISTCKGFSDEQIKSLISETEKRNPGINEKIYSIMDELKKIASEDEINAALISSCQSDPMNCGRCNLRYKYDIVKVV